MAPSADYRRRAATALQLANVLSLLVLASGAAFLHGIASHHPERAALQPPLIYASLLVLLLFPGSVLFRDTRLFFGTTLWRVATPLRSVTWSDFLLADILTSLAKVGVCRRGDRAALRSAVQRQGAPNRCAGLVPLADTRRRRYPTRSGRCAT